uniref:Ig-like domain-containing protein n=1 Tax=Sphaeramia orbicularis TaxID=375764 RepID=A0A673A8I8_9TELE
MFLCEIFLHLFHSFVEVEEGKEFVVLPFITTPESLDGVEVRWFYYEDDECKELLVYPKGSVEHHDDYRNRTEMNENPLGSGNLSLTLSDPKDTDSGKYRCYVKKNNNIITMKTVLLKVHHLWFILCLWLVVYLMVNLKINHTTVVSLVPYILLCVFHF